MAKEVKRIRLNSLTDIQRQMARLYRESRQGDLSSSELTGLSQHLKRLHDMLIQEKDMDINEELLLIESRLAALQERL